MQFFKAYIVVFFFIGFSPNVSFGQELIERAIVVEGDTIVLKNLRVVTVWAPKQFESKKEQKQYSRLYKKVKKVYPLARLAGEKLKIYAAQIDSVESNKEKKKFYKKVEEELRLEYEDQLKKLTTSEGRILIKLIDRETRNTSYELVKNLRGGMTAFFWQGMAKIFGHDLKSQYDPSGRDKLIEEIVLRIEAEYN